MYIKTFKKRGVKLINANELKEYIIKNNKISLLLEKTGCHSIRELNSEYRAALPNKSNPTSVCVKKDTLYTYIRSSDINASGDIFVLVMELNHLSFGSAIRKTHEYLDIPYVYNKKADKKTKEDFLNIFKRFKRNKHLATNNETTYDESVLKEYSNLPHISWIKEGILPFTCRDFNIGYSFDKKRIIIPWKNWSAINDNQYVGVVGRTTVQEYDMLNIPKYLCIQPFCKGNNLYGLYENYETIQNKKYVVVYESEKSVLKRYSRKDGTGVAVGCHSLTSEQVKILIGLNVDIVIAFDKDVSLFHVFKECEKFYKIRNVFYIYDRWSILKEKDSPADTDNKSFEFLFNHKKQYGKQEHELFLKVENNEKNKRRT